MERIPIGKILSKEDNLMCFAWQKYIEGLGLISRMLGDNDIEINVLLPPSEDRDAIVMVNYYN